jgi:hypothetical protein
MNNQSVKQSHANSGGVAVENWLIQPGWFRSEVCGVGVLVGQCVFVGVGVRDSQESRGVTVGWG